ncbi:MAG: hypothetical protein ACJAYU_000932 [Bradymonadia bacterium]|jgi:hypothetical protein
MADIWALLVDLNNYGAWNPFIVARSGTIAVGGHRRCQPILPGKRHQHSFRSLANVCRPGPAEVSTESGPSQTGLAPAISQLAA